MKNKTLKTYKWQILRFHKINNPRKSKIKNNVTKIAFKKSSSFKTDNTRIIKIMK